MIKCPNCEMLNQDGTLLCEGCAWDLMDVPSLPEESAAPPPPAAIMPSGSFDVLPAQAFAPEAVPVAAPEAAIPMAEDPAPMAMPAAPELPAVSILAAPPPPPPAPVAPPPPPPTQQKTRPVPPFPPTQAPRVSTMPPASRPRLVVVRGVRTNVEYPIYDGENFIGRSDETPTDIDLSDQEVPTKAYASRQHARVIYENGTMYIEDLNSANGTFLNRTRLVPHERKPLKTGDYIQTGTVMFQVRG